MNNKVLAEKIISLIGNEDNVMHLTHCVTRLRITLIDNNLADKAGLKSLPGVLGVAESNGQLQVILGNRVGDVFAEINLRKITDESKENKPKESNKNITSVLLDAISGIFSPVIPAIIGAGLLKGIIVLLLTYNAAEKGSQSVEILNAVADAAFYFLPVLLGFSSAKKFGCNAYLGAALGGILIHPALIQLMNSNADFIYLFGLPVKSGIYMSSVLPIILSVWFMSYVERALSRVLMPSLRTVFQPLLTLIITAPVMLALIGPLGAVVGKTLASAFMFLYFKAGIAAGALLGGLYPLVVLTGMHYGFLPIMFESLSHTGFDYIMAIAIAANSAQAGAVLAVFIQTRNSQLKSISGAAAFNAVIGITEPALFGVTAPLRKPLFAVALGGAIGGAFMAYFQIGATGIGTGPLAGLPFFFGPNFIHFIMGCITAFIVSLLATWFIGFDEKNITKQ